MKQAINIGFGLVALCLALTPLTSWAGCVEAPANTWTCTDAAPNPDTTGILQRTNDNDITINMLAGSVIDTRANIDENAIHLGGGRNIINVTDATVLAEDEAVESGGDGFQINLTRAELYSLAQTTIRGSLGGTAMITAIDSTVSSETSIVIQTTDGADTFMITGSRIEVLMADGADPAIITSDGNDLIELEDSLIRGGTTNGPSVFRTINLGFDDDRVVLRNGVTLQTLRPNGVIDLGLIDCGPDTDTIEFTMDVLNAELTAAQQAIAAADPAGDTITINDETYQWVDCENLVDSLTGVDAPPPPEVPETPARPVMPVPAVSDGFQLLLILLMAALAPAFLLSRSK